MLLTLTIKLITYLTKSNQFFSIPVATCSPNFMKSTLLSFLFILFIYRQSAVYAVPAATSGDRYGRRRSL